MGSSIDNFYDILIPAKTRREKLSKVANLDECDICFQEVLKVVKRTGFKSLEETPLMLVEQPITGTRRNKKKGCKTLYSILVNVLMKPVSFEKIAAAAKRGISWRIAMLEVSNTIRFNCKQCQIQYELL